MSGASFTGSYTGSTYEGDKVWGEAEGKGRFTFADGLVYEGDFQDGEFHGKGKLIFPNGAVINGVWEHGREVESHLTFEDGLEFAKSLEEWKYLTPGDRRYHTEKIEGLRPAGNTQRSNDPVESKLPDGSYDVGAGQHYDPNTDRIVDTTTSESIRRPTAKERAWILSKCRVGAPASAGEASAQMRGARSLLPDDEDVRARGTGAGGKPQERDGPVGKPRQTSTAGRGTADADADAGAGAAAGDVGGEVGAGADAGKGGAAGGGT